MHIIKHFPTLQWYNYNKMGLRLQMLVWMFVTCYRKRKKSVIMCECCYQTYYKHKFTHFVLHDNSFVIFACISWFHYHFNWFNIYVMTLNYVLILVVFKHSVSSIWQLSSRLNVWHFIFQDSHTPLKKSLLEIHFIIACIHQGFCQFVSNGHALTDLSGPGLLQFF